MFAPNVHVAEETETEEITGSRCHTEHFDCKCYARGHTIRFTHDPEDDTIMADIYLDHNYNFFERIWVAIKFVSGYRVKQGWESFTFEKCDINRLRRLVNRINY